MTIIYQYKVATASFFGFFKLLACWKGSVYKLIFKETIVFSFLYTIISLIYRFGLNSDQQSTFSKIAIYCNSYTNLIPVSFVLGFYVSVVVTRWWQQFTNVPWPDRTLFLTGTYLTGQDDRGRMIRRTVARYMLFALILILRSISVAVMKRYPTMEHIVDAGFITNEEVIMFDGVECKFNKFWVPLVWANTVLTQARKDNRIESDIGFRLVIEQLADFRDKCSLCFVFDWITIPLVYTQVVTLAVYMFFAACLIGRQYVDDGEDHPDLYVPFFTIMQFFFYMGWLKVAEQLINPFGEDEDDFDMNWLIDRHTAVAMCLADQCHGTAPPLVKDANFNETTSDLPYTEASLGSRRPVFLGSTYNLARPSVVEQRVIPVSPLADMATQHAQKSQMFSGPRHASSGGSGSQWSLFGFKPNLSKAMGSSDTIRSVSTVANGHAGLGPLSSVNPNSGLFRDTLTVPDRYADIDGQPPDDDMAPEYIPLRRARASTDADHTQLTRLIDNDRERKWSFPLGLLRKKQGKEMLERASVVSDNASVQSLDSRTGAESVPLIPQQRPRSGSSRFQVEPVDGDTDVDASKHTRNKQIIDKHMFNLSVSRAPVLSAIEEGNTIRSLKDMVPSPSSHSLEQHDEVADAVQEAIPTTIQEEDDSFDSVFGTNSGLENSGRFSFEEEGSQGDADPDVGEDDFTDPRYVDESERLTARWIHESEYNTDDSMNSPDMLSGAEINADPWISASEQEQQEQDHTGDDNDIDVDTDIDIDNRRLFEGVYSDLGDSNITESNVNDQNEHNQHSHGDGDSSQRRDGRVNVPEIRIDLYDSS